MSSRHIKQASLFSILVYVCYVLKSFDSDLTMVKSHQNNHTGYDSWKDGMHKNAHKLSQR